MDVPGYLYTIGDSQDLPQIPSSISDEAKDFLGKCLVRNAAQRWSADELLEHPFLSVG
jgi:serine/threonine protein kinase